MINENKVHEEQTLGEESAGADLNIDVLAELAAGETEQAMDFARMVVPTVEAQSSYPS